LATLNPGNTVRMTPLWYEHHDSHILLNAPETSTAVKNLKRNSTASLLIDSKNAGIHFTGHGEIRKEYGTPKEIGSMFLRYFENEAAAIAYAEEVVSWGRRVFIKFYPLTRITWDYGKRRDYSDVRQG